MDVVVLIDALGLTAIALVTLTMFISSIRERESRAAIVSGILFSAILVLLIVILYLRSSAYHENVAGSWFPVLLLSMGIVGSILLFLPIGANPTALKGTRGLITGDVKRVDERDTIFSRIYVERKNRVGDAEDVHEQPESAAGFALASNYAAAEASDAVTRQLSGAEIITPEVSAHRSEMNPEEATIRVKGLARHLGAALVGITKINPLWVYSHRGKSGIQGDEWGNEISIDHKYAIVFGMEMDFDMLGTAPHSPISIETMRNYAKGAYIGAHLAAYITGLGYAAMSNQMARYDAMMVPLAIDAGLGELSRMGYLITKEYGPRIRLGAVTTNIPLVPDEPVDIGVVDFCMKCKKCAYNCPTNSIPFGEREVVNGSNRWTIDTDSCHKYWEKVGTDCGICMRVCPWSHARTFPHKLITEAVSRNSISRNLFISMDDLFYGKKPPAKKPPGWAQFDPDDVPGQSDSLIY